MTKLDSLMTSGRTIPVLPDVVRARALARARATVAAAAVVTIGEPAVPPHRRGLWVALAAAMALVFATAGATAARLGWLPVSRQHAPSAPAEPPVAGPHASRPTASEAAPQPAVEAQPPHVEREVKTTAAESYTAELRLLQHAQAAYTRQNFAGALSLVAEHGRRFPRGRLAEQREALRVKSLTGVGRHDEARKAEAAFATRFPRSVLLQRLRDTTSAPE